MYTIHGYLPPLYFILIEMWNNQRVLGFSPAEQWPIGKGPADSLFWGQNTPKVIDSK